MEILKRDVIPVFAAFTVVASMALYARNHPSDPERIEAAGLPETARKQGAWTFGITDVGNSPIARVCHDHWALSVTNPIHNGSYVAPVAALATAASQRT